AAGPVGIGPDGGGAPLQEIGRRIALRHAKHRGRDDEGTEQGTVACFVDAGEDHGGEGRKLLALAQDRGSRRRVEIALRDAAALRLPSVLRGVRALSRSSAPSNRSPAPCCARRPTPGDEVPRETDRDPAEAGKPDPGLHPEREPETGHEPDGGNGTRIEARFAREP